MRECNIMWDNALWDTRRRREEQLYQTQVCKVKCNLYLLTLLESEPCTVYTVQTEFFCIKKKYNPSAKWKTDVLFSLLPKQSSSFSVPEIV